MKELTSLPASVRYQLSKAENLTAQGRPAEAQNARRKAYDHFRTAGTGNQVWNGHASGDSPESEYTHHRIFLKTLTGRNNEASYEQLAL